MNTMIRFLILALFTAALAAQERPREKPVLIRDDKPEQLEEEILPDPSLAKESLKVGQFYFKRKNYKAAASRFREAIRYLPTWHEPYEKLVDALRELKSWQEAIDACDLFVATNPDHEKASQFQSWAQELRHKQEETDG